MSSWTMSSRSSTTISGGYFATTYRITEDRIHDARAKDAPNHLVVARERHSGFQCRGRGAFIIASVYTEPLRGR